MDTEHPFVGDQSPRITLDSSTPHGIRQSGFASRQQTNDTPGEFISAALPAAR